MTTLEKKKYFYDVTVEELIAAFKAKGITLNFISRKMFPTAVTFYVTTDAAIKQLRTVAQEVAYRIGVNTILIAPDPQKRAIKVSVPLASHIPLDPSYRAKYPPEGLKIPLGLGLEGPVYHDFGSIAHLLVAGTTGSGKSFLLHSILQGILSSNIPYLSIVPIDFKRTELIRYEKFMPPIFRGVKEVTDARDILQKLVEIMNLRYETLGSTYKNIDEYNAATGSKLDRIFVVIDEFAEMMLSDKAIAKDVEMAIIRLAQKSRAAGIHLIISTQRPSADVISGQIKANIEARIALKVVTPLESRIILGIGGAENLEPNTFIYRVGHPIMGRVFRTELFVIDEMLAAKVPFKSTVTVATDPYKATVNKDWREFNEEVASHEIHGMPVIGMVRSEIENYPEICAQKLLEILASDCGLAIDDFHFDVQCALKVMEWNGEVKNLRSIGSGSVNVNSRTFREWMIINLKYVKPDESRRTYKVNEDAPAVDPKTAELSEETKKQTAEMLRYMTLDKKIKIIKKVLGKI